MDGTDNAQMGAVIDITDEVWTVGFFLGFHAGKLKDFSPHDYLENFDSFSADGDGVTDGLADGLTDESDDVWMEVSFPAYWTFEKFHTE